VSTYSLRVSPAADRSLARLPEFAAAAVIEFMTTVLVEEPWRVGKPLGLELTGFYVARRGAYRIVYWFGEIDGEDVVIVARINHRADVYRAY
jgi:mRNA-degrading endonuclease RelE of RelBE toxin-antitoxin system